MWASCETGTDLKFTPLHLRMRISHGLKAKNTVYSMPETSKLMTLSCDADTTKIHVCATFDTYTGFQGSVWSLQSGVA